MNESETPRSHSDAPTLDDHPGLDNDEATEEGKMMTASGSLGPAADEDAEAAEAAERDERAKEQRAERST